MWGIIFVLRMFIKEYSNSKKAGWKEYKSHTWFLFPKLYNSNFLSYLVYGVFIGASTYAYYNGGMEKTAKSIFYK